MNATDLDQLSRESPLRVAERVRAETDLEQAAAVLLAVQQLAVTQLTSLLFRQLASVPKPFRPALAENLKASLGRWCRHHGVDETETLALLALWLTGDE